MLFCRTTYDFWKLLFCDLLHVFSFVTFGMSFLMGTPPAPINHVKIFKGWPPQDAHSNLIQLRYKTFPPDHGGQAEMKNATRLSHKTSFVRRIRFWEIKSPEQEIKYLY